MSSARQQTTHAVGVSLHDRDALSQSGVRKGALGGPFQRQREPALPFSGNSISIRSRLPDGLLHRPVPPLHESIARRPHGRLDPRADALEHRPGMAAVLCPGREQGVRTLELE